MQNNPTILNVSELNAEVNQLLSQGFPLLWVEGEVSNLVRPASGHLYFTLKDSKSQIRSAMFRNRNMKLNIQPENGMKVLVRGRVGLYEPRGDYQLIAEHMENAGIGQLQRQFEALKQKLSDAGLFAEEHKKEFPEYPKRIGIITSPTGAAVRDILQVLARRSPQTPILIYPVSVQGDAAKTEIEMAIRQANIDKKCDVLILARGGGSIEDLWSFNEENIARTIYNSDIPIVCGVGHEIDFTIADFVADLRAPTPSAAAELITPERDQLLTEVIQTQLWMSQTMHKSIKQKQERLEWISARLELQKPSNKVQQHAQRLDELNARLQQRMQILINEQRSHTQNLSKRLKATTPNRKLAEQEQAYCHITSRLQQSIQTQIQQAQSDFKIQAATLDSISPLKTLDRGYAIVKDTETDSLISSIKKLKPKQAITIKLKDGETNAHIS